MSSVAQAEPEALDLIANELEREGYEVIRQPRGDFLPAFLQDVRPDAIAIKRKPNLIIEVIRKGQVDTAEKVNFLEGIVAEHPDWKLKVVYYKSHNPKFSPLDTKVLEEVVQRVEKLIDIDLAASFLLAWSLIEAQARVRLSEGHSRPMAPRSVVNALVSEGAISQDEGARLFKLADMRNQLAHGQLDLAISDNDTRDVLDIAKELQKCAA